MILEKNVEINITNRNKNYYRSKGYSCNHGDSITVKIEDLHKGSHFKITAQCENPECGQIKKMEYDVYNLNINSTDTIIYYCNKCNYLKKIVIADKLQKDGKLTRNDSFYWRYKDNTKKELLAYIEKYSNLNNIKDIDNSLYSAIIKYCGGITKYLKELDLNIEGLHPIKVPNNYYTKEHIVNCVEHFIENNNRFPSQQDFMSLYKINSSQFNRFFKDFSECKKFIGYYNNNDLIDKRGDVNKSYYELYTANFLIAQGLGEVYRREENPFENYYYRSDFTFYPENGKPIHVEVWGNCEKDNETKGYYSNYLETRKEKERLYKLHEDNIVLISIEPTVFKQNLKNIEKDLYNIFKNYLDLKYKQIDYELLLSLNSLSEEEVLNLLLSCSKEEKRLPTGSEVQKIKGGYGFLRHIEKRFGGLSYFSHKYNLEVTHKNNYWNLEKVFEIYDYIIQKYNRFITRNDTLILKEDKKLKGFIHYISNKIGVMNSKLLYYEYLLNKGVKISGYLLEHLHNIADNKVKHNNNLTTEQQKLAQDLLFKTLNTTHIIN